MHLCGRMVALEPRTSSLIIPGCEKKVEERKQIRIRDFAGHGRSSFELNEIIRNKERKKGKEKRSILESSTSARKTLQRLSYRLLLLLLDLRSTILSLSVDGSSKRSTRINGNKMNVTRDVHCSPAQLYYLSWCSATVTINY